MGRLDAEAKRKVVELRAAGLSFRKIKAVLELENIKVSAQAIYLFLKEFHGRNGTKLAAGESGALGQAKAVGLGESSTGLRTNRWRDGQLGTLMREASRVAGYSTSPDPPQQARASAEDGAAVTPGGSRAETSSGGTKEDDEDIRIVSVTSLGQRAQQDSVSSQRSSMTSGVGAMTGIFARRRLTPSPATNPVLLARKRLLDKALLHRARVREAIPLPGQQMAPQQRREPQWRNALPPQLSIDLTASRVQQMRRTTDGSADAGLARRGFQPRLAAPPPRVGIRLPSPSAHPAASQPTTSGSPTMRMQHPGGPQPQRREPSPSYPPAAQEAVAAAAWQSLGEQVQSVGSEIRGVGVAVRVLVEQQSRLERELMQQTQVQRQILSTLKLLAARMAPSVQSQPHPLTPTQSLAVPSSAPASLGAPVSSFSQAVFTSAPGSFSQRPPSQGESSRQESAAQAEAFALPAMSSEAMNGFASMEAPQSDLSHASTHSHLHSLSHTSVAGYSQPLTHTSPVTYTQSPVYTPPDPDFMSATEDASLEDCGASIPPITPLSLSPQDPQLNIIKVEAL